MALMFTDADLVLSPASLAPICTWLLTVHIAQGQYNNRSGACPPDLATSNSRSNQAARYQIGYRMAKWHLLAIPLDGRSLAASLWALRSNLGDK